MSKTKFPTTEAEILNFANELTTGLTNNIGIYPEPPVNPANLGTLATALMNAQNAVIEARAASEAATSAKLAAIEAVVEAMKKDLRYAENTVNYDDEKLKLIGWSGRKPNTPMTVPGQVLELVATAQGEGWVTLEWKKPVSGGTPGMYKVYKRQRPEGAWAEVTSVMDFTVTLTNQTRGTEWEFYVVAVNKAGEGMASNMVLAVL